MEREDEEEFSNLSFKSFVVWWESGVEREICDVTFL